MGQVVLSQRDYTNLIVEGYGTGRDLERFSDKFPREKPLNGISWIQIQICLTSMFEHSSLYGKRKKKHSSLYGKRKKKDGFGRQMTCLTGKAKLLDIIYTKSFVLQSVSFKERRR